MKIFEKNFVGITTKERRDDVTMGPLAFLVPYENNAAGRKREETVKRWLYGYGFVSGLTCEEDAKEGHTMVIDNVPARGFQIVDFAERYSTSNKLARIYDPNGFELEISIDNLIDIITKTTIKNGVIDDKMIWARDGANNRLIFVDSDEYRNADMISKKTKKTKKPKFKHSAGDIIIGSYWNDAYLYLGQFHPQWIVPYGDEKKSFNVTWNDGVEVENVLQPTVVKTHTEKKKFHWYMPVNSYHDDFDVTADNINYTKGLEARNRQMSTTKIIGHIDPESIILDEKLFRFYDKTLKFDANGTFYVDSLVHTEIDHTNWLHKKCTYYTQCIRLAETHNQVFDNLSDTYIIDYIKNNFRYHPMKGKNYDGPIFDWISHNDFGETSE